MTTEAGGTATFTVVLNTKPSADVTIALSSSNTAEGTVSPVSLIFTTLNWDTAQTVTVTGVNDQAVDGPITYTIFLDGRAVGTTTKASWQSPARVRDACPLVLVGARGWAQALPPPV